MVLVKFLDQDHCTRIGSPRTGVVNQALEPAHVSVWVNERE